MIATIKLCLKPTKEQEELFWQFGGTARWAYNQSLDFWNKYYEKYNESPSLQDLLENIRDLKYSGEYDWLLKAPEAITKQACKDLQVAFKNFFRGTSRYPNFKKKYKSSTSFYQRTDKFRVVDDKHIKMTGIKQPVKVGKLNRNLLCYLENVKNPRIKFDGKYWYFTCGIEVPSFQNNVSGNLGVDLGIKHLAYCSDGVVYENINYSNTVKKLKRRLKLLQRRLSRKYEVNRIGNKYNKTKNIIKLENKIWLIHRRLRNIRDTYLHQVTYQIVSRAKNICIEDLNVSGMLKNKHLSRAISEQCFYKFRQYLDYKCSLYGSNIKIADRFYPSSKRCSCCGNIKKDWKLSDRTYHCSVCGFIIDRDFQASINLRNYGLIA